MLQRWLRTTLALTLVLLLVACGASTGSPTDGGNDADDGTDDGSVVSGDVPLGLIEVHDAFSSVFGRTTDAFAMFLSLSSDIADAFVDLAPDTSVAVCEVTTLSFDDDDPLLPELPGVDDFTFETLDAGAAVTLAASGAPYQTLEKTVLAISGSDVTFYESTLQNDAPPPGLVAEIPGATDGFPAVNVPLPDVEQPELTAPASVLSGFGEVVEVDDTTTFTWTTPTVGAPDSFIELFVGSALDDPEPTFVSCVVPDTGTFGFPADTQAELGVDFQGFLNSFTRRVVEVQDFGDERVVVTVDRELEYVSGPVIVLEEPHGP